MKVSVCITTYNEKKEDIQKLFDALNKQTLKPDEIILTDGDPSVNSKQYTNIKYIKFKQKTSRARGRNEAIKIARNEIIAVTDVGCVPRRGWLEKISEPFRNNTPRRNQGLPPRSIPGGVKAHSRGVIYPEVAIVNHSRGGISVVAGFYHMTYENNLQKAMRVFLGVLPKNFDNNFMPSARSMAFTKTIWKRAGGFPENLNNAAEDTLFNVNLIKAGAVFIRVKNAVVEWGMPESIFNFLFSIYNYAKGDAESQIWWHPIKHFQSHNIKILLIYLRYLLAFIFLAFGFYRIFGVFIGIYILYSYRKAKLWGILLQFVSDFAVMAGFTRGIIGFTYGIFDRYDYRN